MKFAQHANPYRLQPSKAFVSVLLLVGVLVSGGAIQDAEVTPPQDIAVRAAFKHSPLIEQSPHLRTLVDWSTDDRTVTFGTSLRDPEATPLNELIGYRSTATTVAYWPTCVSRISNQSLLVAGLTERGVTILERWTLGLAESTTRVEPGSGRTLYDVTPPRIEDVEVLYEDAVPTRRMIANVLLLRNAMDETLIVQFFSRPDIYLLNTQTRALAPLVSSQPSSTPGVHVVPDLTPGVLATSADHKTHGYVYVFFRLHVYPWHVLADPDRNGTIDYALSVQSVTEWVAAGLDDRQLYNH